MSFEQDLCEELCFGSDDIITVANAMARAHGFKERQDRYRCLRLVWALSRFDADKEVDGRVGLLQLPKDLIGETGLMGPQYNLNIGFQRLRVLLNRWDWEKALAAFVWGEKVLESHIETCGDGWYDRLPEPVKETVEKVLA